jgi:hypothetical protein
VRAEAISGVTVMNVPKGQEGHVSDRLRLRTSCMVTVTRH